MSRRKAFAVGAFLGLLLGGVEWAWWESSRTVVTIRNESPAPIDHVTISLESGPAETLPSIPAGGSARIVLRPRGEDSVSLAFDGRSGRQTALGGYVEGNEGYRIAFLVKTDGSVVGSSAIWPSRP